MMLKRFPLVFVCSCRFCSPRKNRLYPTSLHWQHPDSSWKNRSISPAAAATSNMSKSACFFCLSSGFCFSLWLCRVRFQTIPFFWVFDADGRYSTLFLALWLALLRVVCCYTFLVHSWASTLNIACPLLAIFYFFHVLFFRKSRPILLFSTYLAFFSLFRYRFVDKLLFFLHTSHDGLDR